MRIQGSGAESLYANVTEHGLNVDAVTSSSQYIASHVNSDAYQVEGTINIAATEKTALVIKNTSATKQMIVTYIRSNSVGAAATNVLAYYNIKLGGEYSSGGTAVIPVNMKADSPKDAPVEAYEGSGTDIVMGGTPLQIDRNYISNSMEKYGKEGVLIIPTNSSVSITHKGSTVAGIAYARVSFYMEEI